jgi:hypothetical protein
MNSLEIKVNAANWMIERAWKRLTAKHRGGVYPEHCRRKQSLFEHTNHFDLTEEEEKILIASVIAHDVGKERPEWLKKDEKKEMAKMSRRSEVYRS